MTFPVLSANTPAATGKLLTRSLRFRSSASAYLNRTPASASNQKTWTWSGWVKRGALGAIQGIFGAGSYANGAEGFQIVFQADNTLRVFEAIWGSATVFLADTVPIYRDPSSWYHLVVILDTTQATSTNRLKIYINNSLVTVTNYNAPALNTNYVVNGTSSHTIGKVPNGSSGSTYYFDAYLAEVNFIDGQALTPSSFGSTNSTTGVWQPAAYTGTYGTNGFYLPFTNTTSTTTLGYDSSGNGNNWTTNNISLTTGVTYDSMIDVPTLTSATAANYCVLNPVNASSAATLTNGNLKLRTSASGTNSFAIGTIAVPASKIYFEATAGDNTGAVVIVSLGLYAITSSGGNSYTGLFDGCRCVNGDFEYVINGNQTSLGGGGVTAGTVIGMAYDLVSNVMSIYRNGTAVLTNQALGTAKTAIMAHVYRDTSNDVGWELNFGQQPFAYSAPSGYVALNTYNLPASTVPNGAAYMAATLYTGTGASLTVANTVGSASFQPDWVWIKSRSAATDNKLTDVVRGVTKGLISNSSGAETTDTNGLTAFGSTGFTVGTDTNYNNSAATYVAWNWKAGGTAVSNTSGSITSSVSANTTSGFSVATYTGSGVAGTIGHGLGVAPTMIIVKSRSATGAWPVYHTSLGNGSNLLLNTTDASASSSTIWNATSPTSSVFSVGINTTSNTITVTYVAYCFAQIAGFSAFGSYTGNGSTDGPFVYTGFRPRWVMLKVSSTAGYDWLVYDSSRDTYNVTQNNLRADTTDAEGTQSANYLDFLSNGFKIRGSSAGSINPSQTVIYAAFAESPFQNSLAR
jgi:hypothetical protein